MSEKFGIRDNKTWRYVLQPDEPGAYTLRDKHEIKLFLDIHEQNERILEKLNALEQDNELSKQLEALERPKGGR